MPAIVGRVGVRTAQQEGNQNGRAEPFRVDANRSCAASHRRSPQLFPLRCTFHVLQPVRWREPARRSRSWPAR